MGIVAGHIAPSGYLSALSPGATLNLAGSLTLATGSGVGTGSVLDFNLSNSTSGARNDQISITGSGNVDYGTGGVLNINAYQSGALGYGTYVLINNTSSGSVSAGTGWTIGANTGASPLQSDSVAVVGNNLDLIVGAVSVFWTGNNTSWDTNPSNTTSWVNAGGSPNAFATGMAVTFGDTYPTSNTAVASSGGNVQVTIQDAGVQPGSTGVTFSNSTLNYIISNATLSDTIGITGTTGLTLNGTKSVTLAGANSFSGPVAVNAGQLILANGAALGSSSGVTLAGGALQLQGNIITNNAIPVSLNGPDVSSGAVNNLSGSNTYTGGITANVPSTIGSTAGTLTLSGAINNNGNLLTFTGAGNTTVNTSGISGNGGLTLSGPGMLTLSAANAYTGTTTINGGTLRVTGSMASSTVNVGGTSATIGGTPTLAGSGTVAGSVEVFGNTGGSVPGHLAPSGFSGSPATSLNITGNLALDGGAMLDFYLSGAPDSSATSGPAVPNNNNDFVNVGGTLTSTSGGTLNINDPHGLNTGTYVLLYNYLSGSSPTASGWNYTLTTPAAGLNLNFSAANPGQFDLVVTAGSGSATWALDGDGKFDSASSWSPTQIPRRSRLRRHLRQQRPDEPNHHRDGRQQRRRWQPGLQQQFALDELHAGQRQPDAEQ